MIYKYLYKDERPAHGIFNKIDNNLSITENNFIGVMSSRYIYNFDIDGFSISINHRQYEESIDGLWITGSNYELCVDGLNLKCSRSIKRKIWKKVNQIFNKNVIDVNKLREEEERMLRKDIKINFK